MLGDIDRTSPVRWAHSRVGVPARESGQSLTFFIEIDHVLIWAYGRFTDHTLLARFDDRIGASPANDMSTAEFFL